MVIFLYVFNKKIYKKNCLLTIVFIEKKEKKRRKECVLFTFSIHGELKKRRKNAFSCDLFSNN